MKQRNVSVSLVILALVMGSLQSPGAVAQR